MECNDSRRLRQMTLDVLSMLVGVGIFALGLLMGWCMREDNKKDGEKNG